MIIPIGKIFLDEMSINISLRVLGITLFEFDLWIDTNIFSIKEVINKDKDNLLTLTSKFLNFKDNILLTYGLIVSTFIFVVKSISLENSLIKYWISFVWFYYQICFIIIFIIFYFFFWIKWDIFF